MGHEHLIQQQHVILIHKKSLLGPTLLSCLKTNISKRRAKEGGKEKEKEKNSKKNDVFPYWLRRKNTKNEKSWEKNLPRLTNFYPLNLRRKPERKERKRELSS